MRWLTLSGALVAGTMLASAAQASLLGQVVSPSYYYPDLATIYAPASFSVSPFTIGNGTETVGKVTDSGGTTTVAVDFSSAALLLTLNRPDDHTGGSWNGSIFNGPVFTFADLASVIASASVDAAGTTMAGFDASRIQLAGNDLSINWQGLGFQDGTTVQIDFTLPKPPSNVPEPATLMVLGLGLAALGVVRRKS